MVGGGEITGMIGGWDRKKCDLAKTGDLGSWQSLGVGCRLQAAG